MSDAAENLDYEGDEGQSEPQSYSLKDHLSEELRESNNFDKFKSVDDLAKSYQGLERMLGERIPIPGEDAGDEKKQEFYDKLSNIPGVMRVPDPDDEAALGDFFSKMGRPDSPDKYEIQRGELPEGLALDEEVQKAFLETAHKAGFNNQQVNQVLGWWDEMQTQALEASEHAYQEAEQKLKSEWGADYDRRLGAANTLLKKHLGDDAAEELYKSGLGNNIALTKMLSDIALSTLEDTVINYKGSPEPTNVELLSQRDELEGNPAYTDKTHANHANIVRKHAEVMKKLYSGG